MNVLPRRLIAQCWAQRETRISVSGFTLVFSPLAHPYQLSQLASVNGTSFLCSELPIRYSHILRLLSSLDADSLPLIGNIAQRYLEDICSVLHPSLRQTPPHAFSQTIHRLQQRQASSLHRLCYALAPRSLLDHINAVGLGIHVLLGRKTNPPTFEIPLQSSFL
jgi:hypothetical protein